MTNSVQRGFARQSEIYLAGVSGATPEVPTDLDALERKARRAMSRKAWAYVAGGAGQGSTMRRNREAFERWEIVPRMATGHTERDLRTTVLGQELSWPVLLAPVGALGLVTPDSDLQIARAAAAQDTTYVLSNQGCSPMEECADAMGGSGHWFQLYWSKDEALVDSFIARAEANGAGALVVTLDTTSLGWRTQDLDLGSLPFSQGIGIAQYTSDPRFQELVAQAAPSDTKPKVTPGAVKSLVSIARNHPGDFRANLTDPAPRAAVQTFLDIYSNPGLSWEHLATLRDRTTLPVVLKGILHPDDARRAFDVGADAIVVSNHGGRQVDLSTSPLDALVCIREELGDAPTVLLDSGIRTGADVFTALALGADAVLLGRPYAYGLAISGQQGVEDVISNVRAELDLTMALTGCPDVSSVGRHLLLRR